MPSRMLRTISRIISRAVADGRSMAGPYLILTRRGAEDLSRRARHSYLSVNYGDRSGRGVMATALCPSHSLRERIAIDRFRNQRCRALRLRATAAARITELSLAGDSRS